MKKFRFLNLMAIVQIILGVVVILPQLNLLHVRGTDTILAVCAIVTGVLIFRERW